MVTGRSAPAPRRCAPRWVVAGLVAALAGGVLLMHTLTGGLGGLGVGGSGADHHAALGHATHSTPATGTAEPGAALDDDASGGTSSSALHCGVEEVCLALLAAGLLLLLRPGRSWLTLPRPAALSAPRRALLVAGLRGPPDLHALSILRC